MDTTLPQALDVDGLLTASAVRRRAHEVYALVAAGKSQHFSLNESALPQLVQLVAEVTQRNYPDLARVPYHSRFRHFDVGGVARLSRLQNALNGLPRVEVLRAHFDLVISSVLLDAGAGASWSYLESSSGQRFSRSEGLAVASYDWFRLGGLSSDSTQPLRVDAERLQGVSEAELASAFQVSASNPLVGSSGRALLLQRLGQVLLEQPQYFGSAPARPGGLADHLLRLCQDGKIPAERVLQVVLQALGPIWPSRLTLAGRSLGDVWQHSRWGLVPFHKLSQWLTYSLCEALELSGIEVLSISQLTGLAEYRNGGLFIDGGVLVPKAEAALSQQHAVSSDLVIEWRALTVALLDITAQRLRELWHMSDAELPLAKVLEGGTWAAGRQLAQKLRADASPPIRIESDGTVF